MALSSSLYGAHRTALTLQRGPGRQNQHNRGLAQYEVAEEASADGRGFQGLQALLDAIRTISERAYPPPFPHPCFRLTAGVGLLDLRPASPRLLRSPPPLADRGPACQRSAVTAQ